MECHTLLMDSATSIPGRLIQHPNLSDPITQQQKPFDITPTISKSLKENLNSGEANKSPEPESLKFPTAEEIEQEKYPSQRVLTVTNEEFYQWKQILGNYKKIIRKNILDALSKT
jgi:hypothetical protein